MPNLSIALQHVEVVAQYVEIIEDRYSAFGHVDPYILPNVSDSLLVQMAKRCGLTKRDFIDLVD